MRWYGRRGVVAGLALLLLAGCRRESAAPATPAATPAEAAQAAELTPADVEMFLAVRAKALTRLEEEVDAAESRGGSLLTRVVELSDAERDASAGLGFEWRRYRWVREEIARLQSAQREREDAALLTVELTRAREDLAAQLKLARDAASRQFLEAQIASLDRQLEGLTTKAQAGEVDARGRELIARVRAELAVQQGRQERLLRRLRDLVERERAGGAPPATPAE